MADEILTMNVEELSMIGPTVDLETVDSIHKKRLLAFINHFVISTSSFLNKLSKSCEQRFMTLENKIQKLEASVIILESKLNSVPGLDVQDNKEIVENISPVKEANLSEEKMEIEEKVSIDNEANEPTLVKRALDPELKKYVKMLQFGVPEPAVRLKMSQEGVDPSLHDEILNSK